MSNKALYENIIRNVSKTIYNALNEWNDDPYGDEPDYSKMRYSNSYCVIETLEDEEDLDEDDLHYILDTLVEVCRDKNNIIYEGSKDHKGKPIDIEYYIEINGEGYDIDSDLFIDIKNIEDDELRHHLIDFFNKKISYDLEHDNFSYIENDY